MTTDSTFELSPHALSRRELLGAAALTATALSLASNGASAQAAAAPAFTANAELKPLPFDPAKLNGLSERLLRSHWENNYGGSVRALVAVKQRLVAAAADKDMPAYLYNEIKREHLLRNGSVTLHDLYFGNLGGNGQADAKARQFIGGAFGSFDAWETEFRRMAAGLGGGSGWVMLGYNSHTNLLENFWMADHAHAPAATSPILVLDMYEHAYHIDFGAAVAGYIDGFMKNVNWEMVSQRLEQIPSA
jgi:superoxide dismutase, Fe-Mn family